MLIGPPRRGFTRLPIPRVLATRPRVASTNRWERPLYPNFPITSTIFDGLTIAQVSNITGTDSNAVLTDVVGPDGRNGVKVQIATGSRGLYFAIPNGPIDLTDCNIELDYTVTNSGSFVSPSNSSLAIVVYSSGSPTSPSSNFVSTGLGQKIWQANAGSLCVGTVGIPSSRITSVVGTGANKAAATYLRLGFTGTAATRPSVTLLGMRIRPNLWTERGSKVPVFLRFDGFYAASHYDYAFQQIKTKFGNVAKMFMDVNYSWLDNHSSNPQIGTWDQLNEIVSAGGEAAWHGGYGSDNNQPDQATYRALFEQHAIRGREMTGTTAPLVPNLDHTQAMFTWYSNVGAATVDAKNAILQEPRMARAGWDYIVGMGNSLANGSSPLYQGGEIWPPADRWNWASVSTNSWSSTPTVQNPSPDVTSFVNKMFDDALANRGMVSMTTHSELGSAGDGRVAFDTALDRIVNNPNDFYLALPNEEMDKFVDMYGGI